MSNAPHKIRFTYVVPRELKPMEVHGVWGGVNDHGELEANVYTEFEALPRETEQIIAADGSLDHEVIPDGPTEIKRYVHGQLLFSYASAKSFHEWLGMQISSLEESMNLPGDYIPDEIPQ
ncbi:MAG: hypothetical protein LBR22_04885 [Desulfovibrio sp.]|jgi:hypothetical protein|nr:hypothetical protein [Desulfovibrio sp.]